MDLQALKLFYETIVHVLQYNNFKSSRAARVALAVRTSFLSFSLEQGAYM